MNHAIVFNEMNRLPLIGLIGRSKSDDCEEEEGFVKKEKMIIEEMQEHLKEVNGECSIIMKLGKTVFDKEESKPMKGVKCNRRSRSKSKACYTISPSRNIGSSFPKRNTYKANTTKEEKSLERQSFPSELISINISKSMSLSKEFNPHRNNTKAKTYQPIINDTTMFHLNKENHLHLNYNHNILKANHSFNNSLTSPKKLFKVLKNITEMENETEKEAEKLNICLSQTQQRKYKRNSSYYHPNDDIIIKGITEENTNTPSHKPYLNYLNTKKVITQGHQISTFSPLQSYANRKSIGKMLGYSISTEDNNAILIERGYQVTKDYELPKWVNERRVLQVNKMKKIIEIDDQIKKKYSVKTLF